MTRTDGAAQRPIVKVARDLDIAEEFLDPYGRDKAKIRLEGEVAASGRKPGKLILVSAITPTPAGEGKTTTSIGLSQGLESQAARSSQEGKSQKQKSKVPYTVIMLAN